VSSPLDGFSSTSRHDSSEALPMKNSIRSLVILTVALISSVVLQRTEAVVPAPDGGYPRGNTAEGQNALLNLTTGTFNTAVGLFALRSNVEANFNTAIGAGTLLANTGHRNTAAGAGALLSNTTGGENTANGAFALLNNTVGNFNTANGAYALSANTTGSDNTAVGHLALYLNETGIANNAFGKAALESNVDGSYNNALGDGALGLNVSGDSNTAVGNVALLSNTASQNTAVGAEALGLNSTGSDNIAVGFDALLFNETGSDNTAIGAFALANSTGSGSIGIGSNAGEFVGSSNNVIAIGNPGDDVDNTTWIGNIYGVSTQSGTTAQVIVSEDGQLGTVASSERFKKDIATMEAASEAILSLRPVIFHYKSDTKNKPQFGLIAEEVAKVSPALVLPDRDGKPYTVRYDAVNAMLLNEFLKEHRRVEELKSAMAQQRRDFEAAIVRQQKTTEALVARLNEQEARIQKVSAQAEMRKPGSQMLVENQ
jgi:hypothetical protein